MILPFDRWVPSAPDVDAGSRSRSSPWLSGAPFAAPAAARPALPSSVFPPDRWLAGTPLVNPADASSFALWVKGAPFICPLPAAAPPPAAQLLLSITCIDGVSTTAPVLPGRQGRWCPACSRIWLILVSLDTQTVAVYEATSSTALGAAAVAAPTDPIAASADASWAPALSIVPARYVAGYRVRKVL